MDLNQIENCINAIISQNDEDRNCAIHFLTDQAEDTHFSYLLAQIITDEAMPTTHRFLCLCFFYRFNITFPPDLFTIFLPLLNTSESSLFNQLVRLLSTKINTEEQIIILLDSSEDASLSYIFGLLSVLIEFIKLRKKVNQTHPSDDIFCEGKIIEFCLEIIHQTQTESFDESDTNTIMNIRGSATKVIDLISIPKIDEDPNPDFIPNLILLLSLPINEALNVPVIINILSSSYKYLDKLEFFNICYQHFQDLSEMSPLSGHLVNLASLISEKLCSIYRTFYESIELDPTTFVTSAISCSILNSDVVDRWKSNINEFFSEQINPEEYDDYFIDCYYTDISDDLEGDTDEYDMIDYNSDEYNFISLRKSCLLIALLFEDEAIEICENIMRTSPYHMEVSYYFLSEIIPSNYGREIDLAYPIDDEDSILFGQYIYTNAALGYEIDGGIIDECIESDDDILLFFIAKAICKSDISITKESGFIERIIPVTMKLLNTNYMFDCPECSSYLEFIKHLFSKSTKSFIPYIEDIIEILLQIFQTISFYQSAIIEFILTFSIFAKIPELSTFIQESAFPLILELFQSENSIFILSAIDFLTALLAHLEESVLTLEDIQPFFEYFIKIISDSLDTSLPEEEVIKLDQNQMFSIMPLIAFFSRSFSPSPFADPCCNWLTDAILSDILQSQDFVYLPSCIVHISQNISEDNLIIELTKAIFHRLINSNSNYFSFSAALSLSTLLLIDSENFLNLISECEIDIKIFLPLVPQILDKSNDKYYIDDLILVAALFKFEDLTVVDNEEEKPMKFVALRTFYSVFHHLFPPEKLEYKSLDELVNKHIDKKKTCFFKDDPFFLNHHFRKINFIEYMSEILPPLDQIPPSFQADIQSILSL